jgi:RHS repeat-associated protein
MEISEAVSSEALQAAVASGALRLTDTATSTDLELAVDQPVHEGRQAGRRVVLTPTTPLEGGSALELDIEPAALVDAFQNRPTEAFTLPITWPVTNEVLFDDTPPRVEQVAVRGGVVEIELSEEADLSAVATAVTIAGQTPTWELGDDRYSLHTAEPLPTGTYPLTIRSEPLDLAGLGLSQAFSTGLAVNGTDQLVYAAPNPGVTSSSATRNHLGFHGHGFDSETGLMYFRNRYYDPETARFLTGDPIGFVDCPSLYAYAGNSPANYSDPLGLLLRTGNSELEVIKQAVSNVGYGGLASKLKLIAGEVRIELRDRRDWIHAAQKSRTMSLLFHAIQDLDVFISLQFVTDPSLVADAGGGTDPDTWVDDKKRFYSGEIRIDPGIVRNERFRLGLRPGDSQRLGSGDFWRFGWWDARLDAIVIHELGHAYGGKDLRVIFFKALPTGSAGIPTNQYAVDREDDYRREAGLGEPPRGVHDTPVVYCPGGAWSAEKCQRRQYCRARRNPLDIDGPACQEAWEEYKATLGRERN